MRDRLSTKILSNGAARYGVYDEEGNLLRYEYIRLEDDPSVEGDLFSKANVLPDGIPRLLGLKMENPQVKDALNVLANVGNLHVWERVQTYAEEVPAVYSIKLNDPENDVNTGGSDRTSTLKMNVSSSVHADGLSVVMDDPVKTSFTLSAGGALPDAISGKYIDFGSDAYITNYEDVYYIPPDATITYGSYMLKLNGIQKVTAYKVSDTIPAGTTTDYLTSTDRNAYPDQSAEGGRDAYYTLGDVVSGTIIGGNGTCNSSFNASATISVDDGGGIVTTGSVYTGTTTSAGMEWFDSIKGKYLVFTGINLSIVPFSVGDCIFIPSDATIKSSWDSTEGCNLFTVSKYQPVTGYPAIPANTVITYLGQLGGGARIEVGSYVGTGTYGSSNPNSLYVGTNCVKVEIRAIYSSNRIGSPFLELHPQAATETWRDLAYFHDGSLDKNSYMRIVDGVLYWYSNGVNAQGNENGVQHTYSIFKK